MTFFTPRTAIRLTAAAILSFGVVACTDAYAADHTVTIQNFSFEPANLKIAAGDTVTFVNADSAPHTATADNGAFDTKRLGKGKSAKFTFSNSATYNYLCSLHPKMKASIVVQ